ncbi:hypothetical protein F383_22702 [Gossypium arboreum]|uniref:Uncharacterized protein n=1 Tax=Gossypium arboreum TaxID=29729 RepID=A0A0B0MGU3_GOSAR|nr:hypothetical protein F383_22702 [Gossypium arboreum]
MNGVEPSDGASTMRLRFNGRTEVADVGMTRLCG